MDLMQITKRPRIADAIQATADAFDYTSDEVRGQDIRRGVSLVRHYAMWVARMATPSSLTTIGRAFSRDHTTVLYAIERVRAARAADPELAARLDRLLASIIEAAPDRGAAAVAVTKAVPQLRPTSIIATVSGDWSSWLSLGGSIDRGCFEVAV